MRGSAEDPRNYKLRVSLRAFRRTRVIWFVARAQKRRTIPVAKLYVYLNSGSYPPAAGEVEAVY